MSINKSIQFKRNQTLISGATEGGVTYTGYQMAKRKMEQISGSLLDGESVIIRYVDDTDDNKIKTLSAYKYSGSTSQTIGIEDDKIDKPLVVTTPTGALTAGTSFSAGTSVENILRQILSQTITTPNASSDTLNLSISQVKVNKTDYFNGDNLVITAVTFNTSRPITYDTVENYTKTTKTVSVPSTSFTTNLSAATDTTAITGSGSQTWVLEPPITAGTFNYPNTKQLSFTASAQTSNSYTATTYNKDSDDNTVGTYNFTAKTTSIVTKSTGTIQGKLHFYGGIRTFGQNGADEWDGGSATSNLSPTASELGLSNFSSLTTLDTTVGVVSGMNTNVTSFTLSLNTSTTTLSDNTKRGYFLIPSNFTLPNDKEWYLRWESLGALQASILVKLTPTVQIDNLTYNIYVTNAVLNVGDYLNTFITSI